MLVPAAGKFMYCNQSWENGFFKKRFFGKKPKKPRTAKSKTVFWFECKTVFWSTALLINIKRRQKDQSQYVGMKLKLIVKNRNSISTLTEGSVCQKIERKDHD